MNQIRSKGSPGTWHTSRVQERVAFPVAMEAWSKAAVPILEGVASTYGSSITYEELGQQLFAATGYKTRMLLGNWIGKALEAVQVDEISTGGPPLTSLVVHGATGAVGKGYLNAENPDGFISEAARQRAAAEDRLACYVALAGDVPSGAKPLMTARYVEKRGRRAPVDPPAAVICPTCHLAVPATGICDTCD